MLGSMRGKLAVIAALSLAMGSVGGFTQPAPTVQLNAPRRAKKQLFGGYTMQPETRWGYRGPGTTAAQIKRASKKTKNIKRHRTSARG